MGKFNLDTAMLLHSDENPRDQTRWDTATQSGMAIQ